MPLVIFTNFLTIPAVREKNKVRLALAIPTGAHNNACKQNN